MDADSRGRRGGGGGNNTDELPTRSLSGRGLAAETEGGWQCNLNISAGSQLKRKQTCSLYSPPHHTRRVFTLLTASSDPPGRYPRHVFFSSSVSVKFQNLGAFHSGVGAAVLFLRRLPACEWRGEERNATPAPGGGGGGRREVGEEAHLLLPLLLPQCHAGPIEGAPGPTQGLTGARAPGYTCS